MENEVRIPELAIYQCPRCERKSVAEAGSQLLCQPCVNEFLARNVGMMQPVVENEMPLQEQVVPLPPMPPQGGDE